MLYPDTVEAEILVHKPWFIATMFGLVFAIFFSFNLTSTGFGELLRECWGAWLGKDDFDHPFHARHQRRVGQSREKPGHDPHHEPPPVGLDQPEQLLCELDH